MTVIDLSFRIAGTQIPADHGYPLYGAICLQIPALHAPAGDEGASGAHDGPAAPASAPLWRAVAVHPIPGTLAGSRRLALTPRSRLTLRLDSERIPAVLALAGRTLAVGGDQVRVGVPTIYPLRPAARLYSRLVVIKGFMDPEPFLDAVRRQLAVLGVRGEAGLPKRGRVRAAEGTAGDGSTRSPFVRRTIRIRDREIVGYAVAVDGLDAGESIRLQEAGVGGRRRFGCGVFAPAAD